MIGEKDNWEDNDNVDDEELLEEEIRRARHSQTVVFICVQTDSEDKSQRKMKSISE